MWRIPFAAIAGCADEPAFDAELAPLPELTVGPVALADGFEASVSDGWVCEGSSGGPPPPPDATVQPIYFVGLDAVGSVRLQVDLDLRAATFPSEIDDFHVYTGAGLGPDREGEPCTDISPGAGEQRIDYEYKAISGTVTAVEDGDLVGLQVEDLTLRSMRRRRAPDWADQPDVTVASGLFAALPVW